MAIHIKESHKGLLHKSLGVAQDKPIPAAKLQKALHSDNAAVKKRAVFAENAKHWHHSGNHQKDGHHRNSGHSGAHRIGKK